MIEEKLRMSKTQNIKEIGVCAKSVQSPIVLLQRLHIGVDSAALAKAAVTDKLSDSVKFGKRETPLAREQKSKKSVSRNSSVAILVNSKNEKTSIQSVNPTETIHVPQSTVPDAGTALSETKSYKFKKKLKRLQKISSNTVTDQKLSEKIREEPTLCTDITATQKSKISIAVSTRKKLAEETSALDTSQKCTVIDDSEQHNLKTNSFQEQINTEVSLGDQVFNDSNVLYDNSATERTAKVKTRSRLFRHKEVDGGKNSLPTISTSSGSSSINDEPLSDDKVVSELKTVVDSNNIDNSASNAVSNRNKIGEINKTNKSNSSPVKISIESSSIGKIEKSIPGNEIADSIKDDDAKNTIKTRSKVHENTKADNSESLSALKSTPKKISNKSSLTEKLIEREMKEVNSTGVQDNNNIKKTILTRSKLLNTLKTDGNDESFAESDTTHLKQNDLEMNLSKVQINSESISVEETLDNSKLSADITMEKQTSARSTRSKLQEKMKIVDGEIVNKRKSVVAKKSTECDKTNSSGEKLAGTIVNIDSFALQENQKNKISNRSKLFKKKKVESDKGDTNGNEVMQTGENNSAPSVSQLQIDNESSYNENVSKTVSKAEENINERKRITTKSKDLDEKDTADLEKHLLQPEKAEPTSAVTCEKLNDTPKSVAGTLKTKENNDSKNNISTRSRLLAKTKVDENKKLTIEKSSDNITVQSQPNQSVSINNEISSSEKLLDGPKRLGSTRIPKKMDTQSNVSTRSNIEKNKTDSNEKSIAENETIPLELIHSITEPHPVKVTEQLIPNDTVQDSLKTSTDLPKTKENILTRSKLNEKNRKTEVEKSGVENKTTDVEQNQAENTVSTRSKRKEENQTDDHKNDTLPLQKNNSTSNLTEAVISNKSLESETILSSSKRLANSTKSPKRVGIKSTRSTRSTVLENIGTKSHEESIVENGAESVEKNCSMSSSSQAQSVKEATLGADNLQPLLTSSTAEINDSSNKISTRSGLANKTRTDVTPLKRNRKSLVEKHQSPSKTQARDESIVHKESTETKDDNVNQQQVCCEKQIVIKLLRCDQAQPLVNNTLEKETPQKKSFKGKGKAVDEPIAAHESKCDQAQPEVNKPVEEATPKIKSFKGKRKAVDEPIVEETPKAKKSKQIDSSESITDLPVNDENLPLIADNVVHSSTAQDTGKSVAELQSNLESDINDTNITKSTEVVPENREGAETNSCLENLSDHINIVENTVCVIESPEISEEASQCDNKRVENEKEIMVDSSGDNNFVQGEELVEEREEGISVNTSENETNTETPVNSGNVVVEESTPTTPIRREENHSLLARKMVEEVINDWAVADDDKTDNNDNNGINQELATPEVIQIDDNDDVDMIVEVPQEAVTTEKDKDERKLTSHNLTATPRKNAEITIDVPNSPQAQKEKNATDTDKRSVGDKQSSNVEKEMRLLNSASEQTSEMSEIEEIYDSNFESVDEGSCTEDNVSQETITYYNSEDISMEVGVSANENGLNDVVMNLKDACDKITADLSRVRASYENNEEAPNRHEPELLCISDDSNGGQAEEEEDEEEVMIIEQPPQTPQPDPAYVEQQNLMLSNQLRLMHQGTPSISVIKASELRDEVMQPPVEYSVKPTEQHVVYPQRQMHSTTLWPASIVHDSQTSSFFDNDSQASSFFENDTQASPFYNPDKQTSSLYTEETVMQCPKCRCEFIGKSRLRRHWLTCGDAMYLFCPFCPNKLKQRRSLINHINTQHADQIDPDQAAKLAEHIVRQTKDAAGVKLKQGCDLAMKDFLRSSTTIPMIQLPTFIRVQCVVCNKTYSELPATYKKTCDECSSDLMTAICQLCRKQYMLSSKVAIHVQGNCIFTGRVKCRECGFVSSGRYHLQDHIIRKHVPVAPEDYVTCGLGCGKTFRVHDALRKHERICSKETELRCKFCDYKAKHRADMKMHVQQHIVHEKLGINADGTVRLLDASQVSQDEDDVRDLITEQQVRSVIRVHCTRCDRNLRLTSNRSSCELCKLSFTFSCSRCSDSIRLDSLHAARLHVIRSHSVKIHECPHCVEKFSYVYDLTRHASKCNAKVYSCEHCKYRTDAEYKMRDHTRRVHYARSMRSPNCKKCGKWFGRGDSLRRHENSNCGVVPAFSCEHCQFKTKTKFSLLRHIQRQHAYIYEHFSFVCDRCNKFYTNMFAYEEHVKNCHALQANN